MSTPAEAIMLPLAGPEARPTQDRWCQDCQRVCPGGEPDVCLGLIPGVSHACCGHGLVEPYVVLGGEPGESCQDIVRSTTLYGVHAEMFFESIHGARIDVLGEETDQFVGVVPAEPTDSEEEAMHDH